MNNAIQPPHNHESEQVILASLLRDSGHQTCREVMDSVSSEDFYNRSHSVIYRAIKELSDKKINPDFVAIDDHLSKSNDNFDYGGLVYLAEMQRSFISHNMLSGAVATVKRTKSVRELLSISFTVNEQSNAGVEPEDIIRDIEEGIKEISSKSAAKDISHISDFGEQWLDEFERNIENRGGISGLATGIAELDERLSGFDREGLFVLAGRPSMGKTLLAQTIIENVSRRDSEQSMFFSLEMSGKQVFQRFVSKISGVCPKKIRSGVDVNNDDWGKIANAIEHLNASGIYLDTDQKLSVDQIRARVRRRINKAGKQSLIVIDYLGLMKKPKADRNDIAIGEITSSLKSLAKEIETPILLLVQGSRAMDKTKRPTMSDLKDSSSIEADADVVMFVHREEVVDPETELKGVTELIIAKDRHNDGNGTVYLKKVSGGFMTMNQDEVATLDHLENMRLKPVKKKGYM